MSIVDYMENIINNAEKAYPINEGDYIGEDGLWHCGKCKTRKQTRVTLFGKERTPMCICKCEKEELEREAAERKRIAFEEKVKEYRRMGFPESDMAKWTFEKSDGSNEKIMNAAKKYVANFEQLRKQGKGLLLFGEVGTGKTYIAACIANALIDEGYPVLMTSFSRIADTVSGMFEGKQEYYDSLNQFPLLVLDDLATERKTEYMQEIVYKVIDARYKAGLPLIVTTNLTSEELKHPSDISYQRTFSRLLEMCLPIKVEGKDKRLEKLKADIQPMKDLLGL